MRRKRPPDKKGATSLPHESGAYKKPHGGRIAVALCYPNSYDVAMGNLGFHQVYHLFNSFAETACERATWEGKDVRTIESSLPLSRFEIIAFSISYEPDVINMARMLCRAGLSLDPEERERRNSPLILAGGVMAFMNPEPMAPFTDLLAVGEAEAILPHFMEAYLQNRGTDRQELLARLARTPGVYVPSLYVESYGEDGVLESRTSQADAPEKIERLFLPRLGDDPAQTRVFTDRAEFSDMALVELGRGCVHSCRFCAAAHIYRPPRFTPAKSIEGVLESACRMRNKAGLVSASATDHPEFGQIREAVKKHSMCHSVASLRLDRVSPDLLLEMKKYGHKTLTVAPEAATERLRRVINKPVKENTVREAMQMIGASGIPRLKLYFQIGLPDEREEDVKALGPFLKSILEALAQGSGKKEWPGRISISVNPFVPKPATPFQWHPMAGPSLLRERIKEMKRATAQTGKASFAGTSVREACLQAVIARGDRRTARVIARCAKKGTSAAGPLNQGDQDVPPGRFYSHRMRSFAEHLPWEFIDHGVDKKLLWKEYEKALAGTTSPPCAPGECKQCDACRRQKAVLQKRG